MQAIQRLVTYLRTMDLHFTKNKMRTRQDLKAYFSHYAGIP